MTVINEIASEQVIVARSGVCCPTFCKGLLDLFHQSKNLWKRIGKRNTMFECQCVIAAHRLEWRKGAWEGWPSMITLHRIDDAAQHIVLGGSFRCDACANDKACDKHVFGSQEVY